MDVRVQTLGVGVPHVELDSTQGLSIGSGHCAVEEQYLALLVLALGHHIRRPGKHRCARQVKGALDRLRTPIPADVADVGRRCFTKDVEE